MGQLVNITITGTYEDASGTLLKGKLLTFTPVYSFGDDGISIPKTPVKVRTSSTDATFSVILKTSNLAGAYVRYQVTFHTGEKKRFDLTDDLSSTTLEDLINAFDSAQAPSAAATLADHEARIDSLEATPPGGGTPIRVTAGLSSGTYTSLGFLNSNGVSFGLSGTAMTASHNGLTNSAAFQPAGPYLTTAMQSDAATISNIKLSAGGSSANLSAFTLSNSNGLSFGLNGSVVTGSHNGLTDSTPFRATSNDSQLRFTSADSQLQFTSANSNFLGTAATQSFRHTSADSQLRFTSADSQLRFTSADTQLQFTSANTKFAQEWALTGNTSGTTSSVQGSRLYFSGGNNVTLSGNSNTIVVSAGSQAPSPINFSAGTTSGNLGSVVFSNSNGVGFGLNGSTITASYTVPTQTVESQSFGMSNLGNTSGTTGIASGAQGRLLLAGGNNITLSQSLNGASATITISGPNTVAQTNQNNSLFALGNTTQNSSSVLNASALSFNGLGGMTVGFSNGSIELSAPQTVAQTNQNLSLYALGNTTQNSSTLLNASNLSFNALGGITAGFSNGSVQLSGPSGGGAVTFSAGTLSGARSSIVFSDSNGVSFGMSGSTITGSIPGSTSLSATGAVSISANGSTISIGAPVQTNQTMGYYATGNTTQSSSGTQDARSITFQGTGNVSVGVSNGSVIISGASAAPSPVNFSAGTTSGNLGSVVFSNSNQVSFGLNGSTITGSVPGTSSLSATGAVSISVNGSTISIGAPNQTNQTMGYYFTGNTTQSSSGTQDARSVTFNGLGMITAGFSNGSIQVSATQSVQQLSYAGVGNTTQNTSGTQAATALSFRGGGGVSVGMSNGSIAISGGPNLQYFELDDVQGMGLMTNVTDINTKPIFVPFILKGNLTNSSMFLQMSRSTSGSNAFTVQAALYTYVNATSIARLGSLQNVFSNASTASVSGVRYFALSGWEAAATALTPGAYVMGLNFSANGGNTASMNYSLFGGQTASAPVGFVSAGTDQNATAPGTLGVVNMWGRYTAGSAALPANVVQTDLLANYSGVSQPLAPWFILRS